jgi:F0F1-type ATP synthase delta subunit
MGPRAGALAVSPAQLAMRYARALFEVSRDSSGLEALAADAERLSRTMALSGAAAFCSVPHKDKAREARFTSEILCAGMGQASAALLREMTRNGRLSLAPLLPAALRRLLHPGATEIEVTLETSRPADEALIDELRRRMEARTGARVAMRTRVESRLLGGFRLLWLDRMIDCSILSRSRRLRGLMSGT